MKFLKYFLGLMIVIFLFTGCTYKASGYKANFESINTIKELDLKPMSVGKCYYENNDSNVTNIGLRGSTMVSPYEGSFADYLEFALKEHFLKNHINANGITTGTASLSAKFILKENEKIAFQQVYEIEHEWPSSFAGAIAIPDALLNYSIAVQKLIDKLMSDKLFLEPIKK